MEISKALESIGHIEYVSGMYAQTSENCLEIANAVARMLGFKEISRRDVYYYLDVVAMGRIKRLETPYRVATDSYFIVRTPDNPKEVHVTFYHDGEEYNFGMSEKDGFVIDTKIPACSLEKSAPGER